MHGEVIAIRNTIPYRQRGASPENLRQCSYSCRRHVHDVVVGATEFKSARQKPVEGHSVFNSVNAVSTSVGPRFSVK